MLHHSIYTDMKHESSCDLSGQIALKKIVGSDRRKNQLDLMTQILLEMIKIHSKHISFVSFRIHHTEDW